MSDRCVAALIVVGCTLVVLALMASYIAGAKS